MEAKTGSKVFDWLVNRSDQYQQKPFLDARLVDFLESDRQYKYSGTRDPGYSILNPYFFDSAFKRVLILVKSNDLDGGRFRVDRVAYISGEVHEGAWQLARTPGMVRSFQHEGGAQFLSDETILRKIASEIFQDRYVIPNKMVVNDDFFNENYRYRPPL